MIVQTEDRNYVRDTASMLLSNVNQSERDAYYNRRTVFRKQKQAINNLQNEVSEMKSELSEIKELLKIIITYCIFQHKLFIYHDIQQEKTEQRAVE